MIWRYVVFSVGTYSGVDTALLVGITDLIHLRILSDFSSISTYLFKHRVLQYCMYELKARIAQGDTTCAHELIENESMKIGL
jgi:hypothetical protein